MLLEAQQAAPPWSGSFFLQSPPSGESRVWLEARQFVRKNCRPDRLCAARLKARQFVIKITNHKKSFGIAPISLNLSHLHLNIPNLNVKKS
jgi:hypothetical protein